MFHGIDNIMWNIPHSSGYQTPLKVYTKSHVTTLTQDQVDTMHTLIGLPILITQNHHYIYNITTYNIQYTLY